MRKVYHYLLPLAITATAAATMLAGPEENLRANITDLQAPRA